MVLATLTIIAFLPVTRFDFVNFDDPVYVTANPRVLGGLTVDGVRWAFTTLEAGFWQPLTWLSYLLDCELSGAQPGALHLTNLLLHAVNTAVLFLVLHLLTGSVWRSATVAALFAVHPLHVESVAWIAQRKDVLSTMFCMLALWAYARYVRGLNPGAFDLNPRFRSGYYWLAWFCFALGLMSKTMVVTLPLVLLLLDFWPLKRFEATDELSAGARRTKLQGIVLEKIPFLAASLVTGLLTLRAEGEAGALSAPGQYPLPDRLANAALSIARYLGQTFWPRDLAVFYPYPNSFPWALITGAVLLILTLSVLAWRMRRRRPYLLMGWFWFLLTLLPVLGLIQVGAHARADRYTYLPLIGIFILFVWGAAELAARWRWPKLLTAAGALLLIALSVMGLRQQLPHWRNSETLFRHALAVTDHNFVAHNNLGSFLYEQGALTEASDHFRESLRIQPDFAEARHNLALTLLDDGRIVEAIQEFRQVVEQKPASFVAWDNLGNALAKAGESTDAEQSYRKALSLEPAYATAHYNLGNLLADQQRRSEAVEAYRHALRSDPAHAQARFNLAVTLVEMNRASEASREIDQLLQIQSNDPALRLNLGRLLIRLDRRDDAAKQFRAALALRPDDREALQELQALEVPTR